MSFISNTLVFLLLNNIVKKSFKDSVGSELSLLGMLISSLLSGSLSIIIGGSFELYRSKFQYNVSPMGEYNITAYNIIYIFIIYIFFSIKN